MATAFRYPPFQPIHHVLGEPIETCPSCGSDRMHPVTRELDAKYRCDDCGRCWLCEFAGIFRVDPAQCPGCGHREPCLERLRIDFAGWWSLPGDG